MVRVCLAVVLFACVSVPAQAWAAGPLETAFLEPSGDLATSERMVSAGATKVRIGASWAAIASTTPAAPTDPNDAAYNWTHLDQRVQTASLAGLEPMLSLGGAPPWGRGPTVGQPGTWPNPAMLAQFARAAATRYSGAFDPDGDGVPNFPEVRYWQVWNEPNLRLWGLSPQFVGTRLISPGKYRTMVNHVSGAVRAANADAVVIAGGTAPFGHFRRGKWIAPGPLRFMRDMLCVNKNLTIRKSCPKSSFTVWSHHPYTEGAPTRHAKHPDNVSIGDLPEMQRVLRAAIRGGKIVSAAGPVRFWVTEFSWDTNLPDPRAVPTKIHARWTSEALYRMWKAGVNLVTWWRLRDDPLSVSMYQSGLYYCGIPSRADESTCQSAGIVNDTAKPSLQAFRFPFVAFPGRNRVITWGKLPPGGTGPVSLQRLSSGVWRKVGAASPNGFRIFAKTLPRSWKTGLMRARLPDGTVSRPFSLVAPRTRSYYPFGCGGNVRC